MAPRKRKTAPTPTLDELKAADEGYGLARKHAVKYLHSRRQAIFSVARHYHLDADDLHQEAYEVLLTCLRDFNPLFTKADGTTVTVLFNTFFGNRLESRALELRNRDPEYQARQAHMADMSDEQRAEFRRAPPLLVQHLDHEGAVQEVLRGEVSRAQARHQVNVGVKALQDRFMERKLDELIAAERDPKRRAALQHVKAGGVSSFEEIAYHFGVTDSRASQIFNELMDAFYIQRLLGGDLKNVAYDFRKLDLNDKRIHRLLTEAVKAAVEGAEVQRAHAIVASFGAEHPDLAKLVQVLQQSAPARPEHDPTQGPVLPAQLTPAEEESFPLEAVELRPLKELTPLGISFRPPEAVHPMDLPHLRELTQGDPAQWPPLLVTTQGGIIDGERRYQVAMALGHKRLHCQLRRIPEGKDGLKAALQLRVVLNARVRPLSKVELYFAICALLELGLPQGRVAELLGTSRPNVIVYAKLRAQGSERLRQLFADGMIQITNASSAVDLPEPAQDELADFIRQHGADWGRGPQFTEAYEAAAAGQLALLTPAATPTVPQARIGKLPSAAVIPPAPDFNARAALPANPPANPPASSVAVVAAGPNAPEATPPAANPTVLLALRKRQEALEAALHDADIWARQREATIASQTEQLQGLRQQLDNLKRELEAQALLQVADDATLAAYLKDLKNFFAVQERLAGSLFHLQAAQKQLRSLSLTHRQQRELEPLLDQVAAAQTALRVQLVRPGDGGSSAAMAGSKPPR